MEPALALERAELEPAQVASVDSAYPVFYSEAVFLSASPLALRSEVALRSEAALRPEVVLPLAPHPEEAGPPLVPEVEVWEATLYVDSTHQYNLYLTVV